jgi:serine/threonine protein kinase
MIGGKIIGQGKAGCIMSPPMICEGETERRNIDNNTLSKLTSIIYSRHEEEVHKLIDSLDPSGNYHIPIDHVCVPRAPILKSNLIDDIKNCNIIQTFSSKTTQRGKIVQNPEITDENAKLFRLILMRDGGNDLLDIGKTILNFPELREKLGGTDFIMMFTYTLFEGLARMTHAGFIHSDIFLTNILYNTATNRFSFIDFGFAFTIDNKLPIYSTRKNAIDFRIPFETLICENPKLFEQYKQDNNLPVDALFDIFYFKFNEVIYRKTLDKYSHYKSASDMKSAIIEGLQNKTLNSLDRDGFRNYIYRKYDVYSLGLTLAIFMRIISGNIYHGRNKK